MSQSPREPEEVDATATQSPNDDAPQQPLDDQNEGDMNRVEDIGYDFEVKEQDRWLPIANVARIMKTALPENAKIAKEAKECMQECVSEFISFITSEASEKCQQEKRKTVNGEDILFAMTSLGFENYGEALKIYLARYRENLVARGEHQKPVAGGSGGNATTSPSYDTNHNALNMDPSGEGAADFGYGAPGQGDY
ncbi:hypothetical protein M409DRAFT_71096 [Zasmidium cellare ATCC 36951]|uniref:Transcription factor CBF/NF-Y/archaeal histone domain-containing protein n=2 Tax=Zasmidium cellare TaxID=395010 RepID=A0A6A6BX08_ZASCE|nr:uncharacterized protein M409DRAFT_71096 [Zasmidium cellare ATCC 36951]KAF2159317.1 hypothetical protein M409DRAFT_71096 [Zasmidium cellare ATCC 36951]KAK4498941.1 hypothetical protein PRZ48_009452 [Zasmidium cellare]